MATSGPAARRCGWRAPAPPIAAPRASAAGAASAAAEPPPVALDGRSYLFVDGGSNEGEAVDAFLAGNSFRCATVGADRVYHARWPSMSRPSGGRRWRR